MRRALASPNADGDRRRRTRWSAPSSCGMGSPSARAGTPSFGGPHAEVEALRAAGDRARGATIYVTLEPCNHHGKTPPCTDALLAAGVAASSWRAPIRAPSRAAVRERLREAGVEVDPRCRGAGGSRAQCALLSRARQRSPVRRLKLALSLDGAIADHTRQPGWFTGEPARRGTSPSCRRGRHRGRHRYRPRRRSRAHREARTTTAVAADARRVRYLGASSAGLTPCHDGPGHPRRRDVLGPRAGARRRAGAAGVTLIHAATAARCARRAPGARGPSLLVEGGATLAAALVQEALVDRLVIFRAPLVLGAGSLNAFGRPGRPGGDAPRWRLLERARFGDDEMTVYAPPL